MSRRLSITGTVLLLAACVSSSHPTTSTVLAPTSTSSTPSVGSLPGTTTVASDPEIRVIGASVVYSRDGSVLIMGEAQHVDSVTVGDTEANVVTDASGESVSFDVEIELPPGVHDVVVEGLGRDGRVATETVKVVVDPDLIDQFAYVTAVDMDGATIDADYAEWLTGDEAVEAATADGEIGPDDELDGAGYYIRNRNPMVRSLQLSGAPVIVVWACHVDEGPCVIEEQVDLETWVALMEAPDRGLDVVGWQWYGNGGLPYWITLEDGVVVQIKEWYLP